MAMENTLPLENSTGPARRECHAHFPGTGPFGEICARCALLVPEKSKFVCSKYKALTGRKGKPISPNSSACKYFEQRRAFNSAKEI
jgi:hypothetical protein